MTDFEYSNIYFLGIGGIGMSALARYFNHFQYKVSGYDKTETWLTKQLIQEGIDIHYEDQNENVFKKLGTPENTLVVMTPAIPEDLQELQKIIAAGYKIEKRAVTLGRITAHYKTIAVAGVHGKTTTSSLMAHLLYQTPEKCNAFLGGIATNFDTNLLIEPESPWMVVEADEYDRSFHHLKPFSSIITSIDADHLDVYENENNILDAFRKFAELTAPKGKIIQHHSIEIGRNSPCLTYGLGENCSADYKGFNLYVEKNKSVFDVQTPTKSYNKVKLGLLGIHNVENALAVIAMCEALGYDLEEILPHLETFRGVKRRFELIAEKKEVIYIDDYAHHPTAIEKLLDSIRLIYKEMPIYMVFQPHLYSRTNDFMNEFAQALNKADEVFLLPIYPAREIPIPGVTSQQLASKMKTKVSVLEKKEVLEKISAIQKGIILTVGAGNIDQLVKPIKELLS